MYEATGTASQQDMLQLRTDLNSLPVSLQRTRRRSTPPWPRWTGGFAEQTAETGKQLSALSARLEVLSGDVAASRRARTT